MYLKGFQAQSWRNFRELSVSLGDRNFLVGPNASGKSNFLDILRFMRDIVKSDGGGLQKAVKDRGGVAKIRCLSSRTASTVELSFQFSETIGGPEKWKYVVGFQADVRGRRYDALITTEQVFKDGKSILNRPDADDRNDDRRKAETHLEQINSNQEFREIYDYFDQVRYFHMIPQLLRHPESFFNTAVPRAEDAFGFHFLEKIAKTPKNIRDSRLKKIEDALRSAVPQLKNLSITRDEVGVPHLEALYEHWRPKAGKQREDQFSDGTLRLIGFLWSILENNSLLLLEEPELSLNAYIVKKIPSIVARTLKNKKKKQQVIISTHSLDLLSDKGIGGEEIFLLTPSKEGTRVSSAVDDQNIRLLLESGLNPAEAVIPMINPEQFSQTPLFSMSEFAG